MRLKVNLPENKVVFVSYEKSNVKALVMVGRQLSIYFLCLIGAIADYSIVFNLLFSVYIGAIFAQFMVIGHDACHNAFAINRMINKIIAQVSFAFPLHSYSLWAIAHNYSHHQYTNVKGGDPVWAPMTKAEYDQQSHFRQFVERVYRSAIGAGFYWLIEMWVKRLIIPVHKDVRSRWKHCLSDSIFVFIFGAFQVISIFNLGNILHTQKPTLSLVFLGYLLPFLVFNWIMGATVYVHHTHPTIPWFDKTDRKSHQIQVLHGTAHIDFPDWLNILFLNITDHTAHHFLPSVPLYELKKVQRELEVNYPKIPIVNYQCVNNYFEVVKVCKLFDFEKNCWTDFNGRPTSSPIPKLTFADQSQDVALMLNSLPMQMSN
jgi:omega-6 fatty acid desaturase (delta-12 desaturase)